MPKLREVWFQSGRNGKIWKIGAEGSDLRGRDQGDNLKMKPVVPEWDQTRP